MLNYYEILDIQPDASASDVRQAYFRAKSAYGKDSNAVYSLFDAQESKSVLERIEEAYLVLPTSTAVRSTTKPTDSAPWERNSDDKEITAKNIFSSPANPCGHKSIRPRPASCPRRLRC